MANMSSEQLQEKLIEARRKFRLESANLVEDFLAPLPEVDQLELVEDAIADNFALPMQAFACSEHESVQRKVIEWLRGNAYDPFVAAILTESEFPDIALDAEFLMGDYTEDRDGITEYFLNFA